jgi:dihydropyrimidinase
VSVLEAIRAAQARAEGAASIDYGFHVITTHVDDGTLADMRHAIRHEGVTSFKMFMAYPNSVMVDDAAIFRAMRMVGQHGGVICLHAENGTVIELLIREALEQGHVAPKYHALTRPSLMEGEATHRGIKLAELAQAPVYFVHLSAGRPWHRSSRPGMPAHRRVREPVRLPLLRRRVYESGAWDIARYVMSRRCGRRRTHNTALWRALGMDQLQVVSPITALSA